MSDLDLIAQGHARTVNAAVATREIPPIGALAATPPRHGPRGAYVALVAAALVTVVGLPFVLFNEDGSVATSSLPAPPTATEGTVQTAIPGWSFVEFDFDVREGSAYLATDDLFFVWGGAPDRSGELRNDGFLGLFDGLRDASRAVPEAPIPGRYLPAMVWSGSEFIIFGGHDFDTAHNDGVAFDPARGTWRTVSPAPLEPDRYPSAVWTGSEMVVWMDDQMAAYDPATDSWRTLANPPVTVIDAILLWDGDLVRLVGGPVMRDLGEIRGNARLVSANYDPNTDSWAEPNTDASPIVDMARATLGPGDAITVLTSPSVYLIQPDNDWEAVGPAHHCWDELAATSGSDHVYIKGYLDFDDPSAASNGGCTTFEFNGSFDTWERLLEWNAYGQTGNTYGSGFVATPDGRLVTFGDADGPTTEGVSGRAVLGVYEAPE